MAIRFIREIPFPGDTIRRLYHARAEPGQNHSPGNGGIEHGRAYSRTKKTARAHCPRRSNPDLQFTVIVFCA
jgi:hypothetical protein